MMGSALGRIATAERMTVDQLKEALQNKTIPAYIAVPLIEEKMNMNSRMQSMAAMQQPKQPPIAEQVLQRASQQGIDQLPSNLAPAEGMAGGGIVAFADGGEADDEEDDDSFDSAVDKENEALLSRLMAMRRSGAGEGLAALPVPAGAMGIDALGTGLRPAAAASEKGIPQIALGSAKEDSGIGLRAPSGHKYASQIAKEAERLGLDPKFALYIAGKETGGLKNPESAKSSAGAMGIMQLMPGTAKDMGVKDPLDPDQNIAGGVRYAKMMLDKYGDPKLAAIAYNWGPGNTDKWLKAGADMSKLPKETRNYVASLKEGGAVKHFDKGGLGGVPVWEDIEGGDILQRKDLVEMLSLPELQEYNRTGKLPEGLRDRIGKKRIGDVPMFGDTTTSSKPPVFAPPKQTAAQQADARALQSQYEAQDIQEGPGARMEGVPTTDPTLAAAAKALEGGAAPSGSSFADKLEALLSKREKGLETQREQDKYMALLTAGLGMMGGTSRNALENISKGALQGVGYAQSAAKQRAAEENAMLSGRLGQYRVGQTEALRKQLGDEAQAAKFTQQLSTARSNMIKNVAAAKKMDIRTIEDPKLLATIEAEADAMLARDPAYQAIYKRIYGSDFAPSAVSSPMVDAVKKYGLTPRKQ